MKIIKENKDLLILSGNFKVVLYTGFFLLAFSLFLVFKYPDWSAPSLVFLAMAILLLLFTGNKELIIDKKKGKIILDYRRLVYRKHYQLAIARAKNIISQRSALGASANCYFLNISKGPQIYIGVDPYFDLSRLLINSDINYKRKAPKVVDKVAKFLNLNIK